MLQAPSEEKKIDYENLKKEIYNILKREKRIYMKIKITELEENRKKPKKSFENSKQIKEGFKSQIKKLVN